MDEEKEGREGSGGWMAVYLSLPYPASSLLSSLFSFVDAGKRRDEEVTAIPVILPSHLSLSLHDQSIGILFLSLVLWVVKREMMKGKDDHHHAVNPSQLCYPPTYLSRQLAGDNGSAWWMDSEDLRQPEIGPLGRNCRRTLLTQLTDRF